MSANSIVDDRDNFAYWLTRQCFTCKHVDLDSFPSDQTHVCTAFPGGIPNEIWENRYDHRKPYPGDRGIHWEEVDE